MLTLVHCQVLRLTLGLLLIAVAPRGLYADQHSPVQRHNPFAAKPVVTKPIADTAKVTPRRSAKPAPHHHPRLKAILSADDGALVNLAGVILSVGDASKGYRLVAVREQSALFTYGRHKIELTVATSKRQQP